MIYVTGDTHGDLSRFKWSDFKQLRRGDTLIICGDFGFIWAGGKEEERALHWLSKRPYRILFVEGTHDNIDRLGTYPVVELDGAPAHQIRDNIFHLIRGGVFTIEGQTFLAFGGGESQDYDLRVLGETWWENELPTEEELQAALQNLALRGNEVDYIITHEAPGFVGNFIDMEMTRCSTLHTFFDDVAKLCRYKRWYFGCYHLDRVITGTHVALFTNLTAL